MITKQQLKEWILLNGNPSLQTIGGDTVFYDAKDVQALIMKLLNELNRIKN